MVGGVGREVRWNEDRTVKYTQAGTMVTATHHDGRFINVHLLKQRNAVAKEGVRVGIGCSAGDT